MRKNKGGRGWKDAKQKGGDVEVGGDDDSEDEGL